MPGVVHVLLLEDAPDAREILSHLLELSGLHVIPAGSAAEALAIGRGSAGIDLLVTDLELPDGSGSDVASELADLRPAMRCLFLSGHAPLELAGGQAFLRKPAGIAEILRAIDVLLGRRLPAC